jgi:hypothetical protein
LDSTSFSQQQLCTRRSGQVVMTEEQLEALRRQISVYATICQQLVEMHKASLSKEISAPGIMATGVQPSSVMDQVTMTPMHRATVRQRWTPSQNQLQILERLFEQGNGTPSKQRIKEITTELMQHGHVGETNVYNWFQNRKARAKRKQQVLQGIHHPPSLRKFLQLSSIWVEVEFCFVSANKVQLSFHHICREVLCTL